MISGDARPAVSDNVNCLILYGLYSGIDTDFSPGMVQGMLYTHT